MPGSSEKAHAGGDEVGVAADEVGPLVHVHADAVADAVGEVFVVGAEAGVGDDVAGGGVDGLASGRRGGRRRVRRPGPGGRCRRPCAVCRVCAVAFAVDEGAGDVGLVAVDGAAVVDEDDLVFADDLRLWVSRGVGRRRRRPGSMLRRGRRSGRRRRRRAEENWRLVMPGARIRRRPCRRRG